MKCNQANCVVCMMNLSLMGSLIQIIMCILQFFLVFALNILNEKIQGSVHAFSISILVFEIYGIYHLLFLLISLCGRRSNNGLFFCFALFCIVNS